MFSEKDPRKRKLKMVFLRMRLIRLNSDSADITNLPGEKMIKWWFRHPLQGSFVSVMSYCCRSNDDQLDFMDIRCNLINPSVFNPDKILLTIPNGVQFDSPSGAEQWDMISGGEFYVSLRLDFIHFII